MDSQFRLLTLVQALDDRMQINDEEISLTLKAEIMGVHDISMNNASNIETKHNKMLNLISKLEDQTQETADKNSSAEQALSALKASVNETMVNK